MDNLIRFRLSAPGRSLILTNHNMKYFLYCRKSQEAEDRQILSLEAQERELKEFCTKYNLITVATYHESQTAFVPGRPKFNEMLDRISSGEAEGIIVWHPNRIARNAEDSGRIIGMFDRKILKEVRTPNKTYLNNSNDKFFLNFEFAVAKKSSDDNSEAVRRGNKEKFFQKQGWSGVAPSGYLNHKVLETGENVIIPDPKRFHLIQRSIKAVIYDGKTPMEALDQLNNDWKYRSPRRRRMGGRPMSRSTFYKVLSNSFYYGWMVRKEGEAWGKHEPMITESEFERLQILLGTKGRSQKTDYNWAYKPALTCAECGASITCEQKIQIICSECKTKFHKGKTRNACPNCGTKIEEMRSPTLLRYVYYHCTKKVNPNCSQGSVEIKELERQISNILNQIQISPALYKWVLKLLRKHIPEELNFEENIKNDLEKRHEDCRKEIQNLLRLNISAENANEELLSKRQFSEEMSRLKKEKKVLEEQINTSNVSFDNRVHRVEEILDFAKTAPKEFLDCKDNDRKTEILVRLGSNLTIKDKKLCLESNNPYLLIVNNEILQEYDLARLEPEKYFIGKRKVKLIEEFIPAWLGD